LNKELAAKIHHSGASYGEDRAAVSEWKTIIYRIQKQISGFFLLVCVCVLSSLSYKNVATLLLL
jgi:hypothetical protein